MIILKKIKFLAYILYFVVMLIMNLLIFMIVLTLQHFFPTNLTVPFKSNHKITFKMHYDIHGQKN